MGNNKMQFVMTLTTLSRNQHKLIENGYGRTVILPTFSNSSEEFLAPFISLVSGTEYFTHFANLY
jgi:hypothetical protein